MFCFLSFVSTDTEFDMHDADDHMDDKEEVSGVPSDGLRAAEATSNHRSAVDTYNGADDRIIINIQKSNSHSNRSYESYSSGYYNISSCSSSANDETFINGGVGGGGGGGGGGIVVDVHEPEDEDDNDDESCYDSISPSSEGSQEFVYSP